VLADVDHETLPLLLAHLRKFRLRAAVDVADVSHEHRVWALFGPRVAHSASLAAAGWSADPRLGLLGSRGVFPADVVPSTPYRRCKSCEP
jgi:folate-binding Fe-S cluster repair protein YgfZ